MSKLLTALLQVKKNQIYIHFKLADLTKNHEHKIRSLDKTNSSLKP